MALFLAFSAGKRGFSMGKRGPRPMTAEELRVRGSKLAAGREAALALPLKAPPCPKDLGPYARSVWRKVVPVLLAAGRLSVADAELLRAYCEAAAEARTAAEMLEREGRTFRTDKGYIGQHPAVAMQRSAWRALCQVAKALGIEPSGRAPAEPEREPDPFEQLLDRRAGDPPAAEERPMTDPEPTPPEPTPPAVPTEAAPDDDDAFERLLHDAPAQAPDPERPGRLLD